MQIVAPFLTNGNIDLLQVLVSHILQRRINHNLMRFSTYDLHQHTHLQSALRYESDDPAKMVAHPGNAPGSTA
jgi:hypothetical protein